MSTFKLADGNTIPAIAYGVGTKWFKHGRNEVDGKVVEALKTALKEGFIHIDAAEVYNTDKEVGEAIAGHKRENLYITDKYLVAGRDSPLKSPHGAPYDSLKYHLKNDLKTDYVDLYLLHSPFIRKDHHGVSLTEAWQSLEKLKDEGYAKSIGVSNFRVEDLEEILKIAKHKPVVNEIEFNALLQNQTPGIVEYSKKNDILILAYSPLGPVVKGAPEEFSSLLDKLAKKYEKTPAQILLRWVIQRDILPITTSAQTERIRQYLEVLKFKLDDEDVKAITETGAKQKNLRQYWLPEYSQYD